MFKIPAKRSIEFLTETDKYKALINLCNYMEDTCTKEERLETIYIRKAIDAALALCCALANDPENDGNNIANHAATKLFSDQFECLFEFIRKYCKDCYLEARIKSITEMLDD